MMASVTTLRPSFAERDAFRSALSQAYAEGRIDDAEFERRSVLVEGADDVSGLRRALKDLPHPTIVFPNTFTRAEALRLGADAERSPVARRAVLGAGVLGAGILGFAVAGGFGRLFASADEDAPNPASPTTETDMRDYLNDADAAHAVLEQVSAKGYRRFVSLSLHTDMFLAGAQSLTNSRGIDSIACYSDGEMTITASSHLPRGAKLFALDDIAVDRVPAMAAAALETIGGRSANFAEAGISDDGTTITVYIDGDDYGVGSGSMEWTADGTELIRTYRADED